MKRKLILIISILVILIANSCKDNGVSSSSGIKTPREMTWTSVTLTSPDSTSSQLLPENLLAFSPTDMWLVCWCDVARGLLWHYNADGWKESNIFADVGGMRVNDVAGSSSYDLWAAGYSGKNIFLGHYNGSKWTREDNMGIEGEILDMCKDDEGNIWACGRNGVILKYTDSKWISDTLQLTTSSQIQYYLQSIQGLNIITLLATTINNITLKQIYYYLRGDWQNFSIVDSMRIGIDNKKWGYRGLYITSSDQLYSYGQGGVWSYTSGSWNNLLTVDGTVKGLSCVDNNYMVAVGDYNKLLFYNGSSWESISDLFPTDDSTFVFSNVWTNGYETIIVGYGTVDGLQKTIIWHGK